MMPDSQTYIHPVLGMAGAYLPPHDVFELSDYTFSKSSGGDIIVEGVLRMECNLLEEYLSEGWCKAYMLIWNAGMVYRKCVPIENVGRFTLVVGDASIYANSCTLKCVIVAERDIPNFFDQKCHNVEYGSASIEVKRGSPLAISAEIRLKNKVNSVGSAFQVKVDDKLQDNISFKVECDSGDDYIRIMARSGTAKYIKKMLKVDRPLFDNVVLTQVLMHALPRMEECKESVQWASALAQRCEQSEVTKNDIDDQLHVAVQKLLYVNKTTPFERLLKWSEVYGKKRSRDEGVED